ncbi:ATP-dependent RNA helicase HrpA [Aliamphritea hakodatensis]|uniref:ATP-dependent RNA helicase HrpA n=1 Tax=Aliamphritea hakodatensis TaxID=2895352 RepID=UPI0022FD9397|nr:ATP-dependent RNA helicase HrpA [Aliamphritea hakodatensis]
MSRQFQSLYQRLDECLISDRFRLRQKLGNLSRRAEQGQPFDKLLADTEALITESESAVRARAYDGQNISFPDLPVSSRRDEIAEAIQHNQVVVIAGETGSGKTTQLPKICLQLGLGTKGLIGHTQPRRLAARTVANRIAEELGSSLGSTVGYQVRFTEQVAENTQVKLMTDGILLAETQRDRYLEKYQVLIIDEAHERSLNIDFLLGYLRQILPKRPDLKVIITSATIDLQRFSKHFNNAPVIEVSGRTYPVEVLYRPLEDMPDSGERSVPEAIVQAAQELQVLERQQQKGIQGDILVFLSGEREIREAAEHLRKAVTAQRLKHIEVMPLYARLSVAEQNKIFHGGRGAGRRIVLATNVAETSLTVPGIRYVIDPGLARISRYSYRSKVQRLPVEAVSQASANQRMGRCGRVAEGVCIRLYSEEDFNSRPEFTDAEIRRTNLAAVILQMLTLRLGNIEDFPFIDPPDSRYINDGFKLLQELGAVDDKRKITSLGWQVSKLPIDPRIARMVVAAVKEGCLREMLIIASALTIQDPRERPFDKQQAADEKHRQYADKDSDFVTLVNLWALFEEQRQELSQNQLRKYCQKHFLSYNRMREWRDVHRQLHLICKSLEYKELPADAGYDRLHRALLSGLLGNIGFKQENKEYLGARNRRFYVFPGSGLYKSAPKWIMAAEVVETSKLYARMVAKIDPLWAEPLAGHLVKRNYFEPHWEKKRAQVIAQEQVSLYGLIIVPKRNIDFGKVDPLVSHDIFIRSALVEGQFHTKGKFFAHNRRLLTSVEGLEAKSRRKDLLVDEDTLCDFYTARMAKHKGDHVVNGAGFEKWRKTVENADDKILFLTEADILQRSTEHVTARQYPEVLKVSGAPLKLSYHFEPGAADDGVSVSVPLVLLNQIPLQRLEWLVPGMLKEKCVALLKGLPKQIRKNYVPIPDYVDAFIQSASFGEGKLEEALAHQMLRMTGVRLDPQLLEAGELEAHHRVNIKLLGDKGKLIAQSRDWQALSEQYGEQAEAALTSEADETWGRKGITRWDFGDLPESVTLKQAGGIEVELYPALVDRKESVELVVVEDKQEAVILTRRGVIRLAWLNLPASLRQVKSKLVKFEESALLFAKVQRKEALREDILLLATEACCFAAEDIPRSEAAFLKTLAKAETDFISTAKQAAEAVNQMHHCFHRINKQLSGKMDLRVINVLNDIKLQLSELMHAGYLSSAGWQQLQEYPRYLKAIELRLEKYQRELPRQRMLSDQLVTYMQGVQKRQKDYQQQRRSTAELTTFRWLLEEYRVSLFAQQLGTRQPVSEKRIKQAWQTLSEG